MKDKNLNDSTESKASGAEFEQEDEFVKAGMKPLTDEQLDQAIGGIG